MSESIAWVDGHPFDRLSEQEQRNVQSAYEYNNLASQTYQVVDNLYQRSNPMQGSGMARAFAVCLERARLQGPDHESFADLSQAILYVHGSRFVQYVLQNGEELAADKFPVSLVVIASDIVKRPEAWSILPEQHIQIRDALSRASYNHFKASVLGNPGIKGRAPVLRRAYLYERLRKSDHLPFDSLARQRARDLLGDIYERHNDRVRVSLPRPVLDNLGEAESILSRRR
jgi:hypothetical protein